MYVLSLVFLLDISSYGLKSNFILFLSVIVCTPERFYRDDGSIWLDIFLYTLVNKNKEMADRDNIYHSQ